MTAALDELLVEAVGEPARVEAVLEAPRAVVVGRSHPAQPGTATGASTSANSAGSSTRVRSSYSRM